MKYVIQLIVLAMIFAGCSSSSSSGGNNPPANLVPMAFNDFVAVDMDTAKNIRLQGWDNDGFSLTYTIVSQPSNGTLGSLADNNVTYTPTTGSTGSDSFTFKVNDGKADSPVATVSITVSTVPVLLKTGQIDSNVTGDDGFYQLGAARSYTRNIDDTVTDNTTGLMWQDDNDTDIVTKPWVTQANYDDGNYSDISGDTAATYCSNLALGGYSDWRLPSRAELISISDFGTNAPPAINTTSFLNTAAGPVTSTDDNKSYWSATKRLGTSKFAWNVNFYYGGQYSLGDRQHSSYVRCVRTLP